MANSFLKLLSIFFLLISLFTPLTLSKSFQCESELSIECTDKSGALSLKLIAIFSILITSIIGVSLPLLTRSIPALHPDRDSFVIVKAFAAGIILATGFMHVLPDSFDMLRSRCLKDDPWHKFPFTGFVAMLSAMAILIVDSIATSIHSKQMEGGDQEMGNGHFHGQSKKENEEAQLQRYKIIAMMLEFGIIVHSVVIGLSLGASNNKCSIKGLVAALCFHQMFEGMGLGGCILQAEYMLSKRILMVFFFSVTTPFGIALGIGLSKVYKESSHTALITVGLLNASSAGLLIYMAVVDLLAAEFLGPKLQGSIKLQIKSYAAALLGAGCMSLMAIWA